MPRTGILVAIVALLAAVTHFIAAQEAVVPAPAPDSGPSSRGTMSSWLIAPFTGAAFDEDPGARLVLSVARQMDDKESKPSKPASAAEPRPKFDPAVVSAGQASFEQYCTKCHGAERALSRTKDLAGWRATVQRMANRQGANIPSGEIEPIATYLASRSAGPAADAAAPGGGEFEAPKDTTSLSGFLTASPLWRGGNTHVQNPGFFPETWVGATWQGKVLSARLTACVSCHGTAQGDPAALFLSRVEVVEALARVDFSSYIDHYLPGVQYAIEAGRLIVPFGAFSSQVNPSLYRTVSKPLIFNMGQRVYKDALGEPVLPMPYADEGINANLVVPIVKLGTGQITATLDTYLVNGLAGDQGDGVQFYKSRDLVDNNFTVAEGGRVTVGGPNFRLGSSMTHGSLNDPTVPDLIPGKVLHYSIYGFDVQARYEDLVRFQIEWARRDNGRVTTNTPTGTALLFTEHLDGYYAEGEVRPWRKARVSMLARYDWMHRDSRELPTPASTLPSGVFSVDRFTLGLNIELWRQSLLMLDWEHWALPLGLKRNLDVYGVRYAITF
jgi:mono/diheme cytochrome c family protein